MATSEDKPFTWSGKFKDRPCGAPCVHCASCMLATKNRGYCCMPCLQMVCLINFIEMMHTQTTSHACCAHLTAATNPAKRCCTPPKPLSHMCSWTCCNTSALKAHAKVPDLVCNEAQWSWPHVHTPICAASFIP
jgi:hypothetical protein